MHKDTYKCDNFPKPSDQSENSDYSIFSAEEQEKVTKPVVCIRKLKF
jgi:hypothetical protein